ncbi:PREDICTED: uncharacterized protein LOC106817092 [Priapulus caudatus]|uniref:Uncharacterized protein LOC106817092 n=1 Tax=Priapulus caudatus TaxID=37621 RepID=A0ABM1EYF5_PRICU|nr:PREDICTED: uncharacterized protein LOC106817092 [Priapulus caudatus]
MVLRSTLSVQGHTSLSFRTCAGGELLYQRGDSGDTLRFEVLNNGTLLMEWLAGGAAGVVLHPARNLADNQWHVLDFRQSRPLVVTLAVDATTAVVSNPSVTDMISDKT